MNKHQRKVRIRPIKRQDPDLRRIARALIELAIVMKQTEATEQSTQSEDQDEEAA